MAEYIKFRLTSAKVGVTMALAALVGGAAEQAEAQQPPRAESAGLFVKLGGITGEVRHVLAKIEKKCITLTHEIGALEAKLRTDYYKKADVNKKFLTIRDAKAEFLRKDATGGFVLGNKTRVITGAATVGPADQAQTLLRIPNGSAGEIIVVCEPVPGAGFQIVLENKTGQLLPAVQTEGGQPTQLNLKTGNNPLATQSGNGVNQLQLQIMPTKGFSEVVTLTVSIEPALTGSGTVEAVGQAFTGGV